MNVGVGERGRIAPEQNVLLPAALDAQPPLVDQHSRTSTHHVVRVVAGPDPRRRVDHQQADAAVDDVTIIQIDTREAAEDAHTRNSSGGVHTISGLDALDELGMALQTAFANAAPDATVELHFDALDALVDELSLRSVFVFLTTVTALVAHHGAAGVYRIDHGAHDPRVIRTLDTLFESPPD